MLPDSILPTPEDDIARIIKNFEKRLSHLERLENFESGIGARVFNSAAIVATDGVVVNLTFDSERFDTDTIHSTVLNTDRLTAITAGVYVIVCNIRWVAAIGGTRRALFFQLNGITNIASDEKDPPDNVNAVPDHELSTIYELAANDYVIAQVFQDSGANINISAVGNVSPEFMMVKIG